MDIIFQPVTQLEIVLAVFALVSITYLGLAVYLKDMSSWTNRLFFLLALSLDTYVVLNIFTIHPTSYTAESQLFWIRAVLCLGVVIAFLLFMLIHTFPKKEIQLPYKYLSMLSVFTIVFGYASLTPLVFSSMNYPNGSPTPVTGPLGPFYLIYTVGVFLVGVALLIKRYRHSSGINKTMFRYFLIGIGATFSLIAIFNIIFPIIFKESNFIFLGPIYPIILMLAIGYAIVRHHFLNIQPVIYRAVSYILAVIILTATYSFLLLYGSSQLFNTQFNIPTLVITLFLAITFYPLSKLIRKVTDRIFFKDMYDAEQVLADLTHVITSTINFEDLSENLLSTIVKEMRVMKAGILLINEGEITDVKSVGYEENVSLRDEAFVSFVEASSTEKQRFFVVSELESEQHKNLFHKYEVEALFPIRARNKIVAVILLGAKLSGTNYSSQDLNLLDVFASESGVAIANSQLYTELKVALDSKSRFLSVVSHQLRTPISGIRWGLETLKGDTSAERNKDIIDVSYEKSVFLSDQLDDILIALDILTKDTSIQKTECDILAMCTDVIKEFKVTVAFNKLRIVYEFNDPKSFVKADLSKTKKILKVVIKNALVYSESSGTIKIGLEVKDIGGKNMWVIKVEDAGIGITKEEESHLFEQFFRSDRARVKLPDGLGLGLHISKVFANAQGGDIAFESSGKDQGAKFYISLPVE